MTDRTAYLAPQGFLTELEDEIKNEPGLSIESVHGNLVVVRGAYRPLAWAQNSWLQPVEIPIKSISDGAKHLRALHGRWAPYSFHLHRRAQLIQEQLPKVKAIEMDFLGALPDRTIGSWTLLSEDRILASAECTSRFPNGEIRFKENKVAPPSRAYLKLWELFTVHGFRPKPGDRVLDMGSCPGGWTWVLQQLGCHVISVDRADLDPKVARLPNIEFIRHSAFTLKPENIGRVDWFFSDIICEPKKLFELVETWRASGLCENFACTIKFKGATDHATTRAFSALPDSRVFHLFHNKHELTWVHAPQQDPDSRQTTTV